MNCGSKMRRTAKDPRTIVLGSSIFFAILALLFIFISLISPLYFIFSEDAVEIVYNFRQRETIKWKDVREVYQTGSWFYKAGGLPHYVLLYPKKEKRLFFVTGEIPKTRKTKKLIIDMIILSGNQIDFLRLLL